MWVYISVVIPVLCHSFLYSSREGRGLYSIQFAYSLLFKWIGFFFFLEKKDENEDEFVEFVHPTLPSSAY